MILSKCLARLFVLLLVSISLIGCSAPHKPTSARDVSSITPPLPRRSQAKAGASLLKSAPVPFAAPTLWLTWEQQRGVTRLWNRNPESNVIGYRFFKGFGARSYDTVVDVGNAIRAEIPISAWGLTHHLAVTAYDSDGLESDYSAEVTYTAPPVAPWLVRLVRTEPTINPVGKFVVESKPTIAAAWSALATVTNSFVPITATGSKLFRVGKLP